MSPPRPPHRPLGMARFGLASTMLRVTAAEMADSGRTMRARKLQDQRAVVTMDVEPGVLTGTVQGSTPIPYSVRWTCAKPSAATETVRRALAVDDPARATRLVPSARDLRCTCDCPDDGPACKHAIAVLLELSDDIGQDATVLATWRGVPLDATGPVDADDPALDHTPAPVVTRPTVDAETGRPALRLLRGGRDETPPFVDPLGDALAFPTGARLLAGRPAIRAIDPPPSRGPDDLAREVLIDALVWMQGASPW